MIRFTEKELAHIVSEYQDGRTAAAISRQYGCSIQPIIRNLKRAGVYDGQRSRAGHDYTRAQLDDMVTMYADGASIYAIAKKYAAIPQSIWRILNRFNVEFRDNAWKGGVITAGNGRYRAVWVDPNDPMYAMANVTGYAMEHRLVMARSIGRPLTRRETVHHINGDPLDNRLENLQLRQGNHGKGARFTCLDCGSHNVRAVSI